MTTVYDLLCRFEIMTAAGLKADTVTYNTLLKCCMRNDLPDKALLLFDQMTKATIPVSSSCPAAASWECAEQLTKQQFMIMKRTFVCFACQQTKFVMC